MLKKDIIFVELKRESLSALVSVINNLNLRFYSFLEWIQFFTISERIKQFQLKILVPEAN